MALPTLAPSRLRRIHSMPAPPHVAGLLNYESPPKRLGHKCIYTTAPMQTHLQALRHQNDVFAREKSLYEDLYRLFMTLPSADAIEMLHRLRSGAGVESIVLHVGDGDAVSSF
ncbi:hypothetical protein BN1723_010363 [Verticillium longisporum]|uniref:Uncharacterized protein n=1 Tax=Verticillium longisporum TaxID=100787 RepID=A0A0G4KXM0_VERLO|nr:hypothetical protein BN1723_010363 [Verticillium longisporum]